MVDFAARIPAVEISAGAADAGDMAIAIDSGAAGIAAHSDFCRNALAAPPQGPSWTQCWHRHVNDDIIVAALQAGGRTLLSLPLEIVASGPLTIARPVGGRHANGNFPAIDISRAHGLPDDLLARLSAAMRRCRPDVDLMVLDRLTPSFEGYANPLVDTSLPASPNPALAVDLSGGFDAVLERSSAKRKRKKHRSQTRKFEAAGGFRRLQASTPQDVDLMLDAFFAMKAHRFRKMGVRDVFGEADIQAFFRDLFKQALGPDRPEFVLHALEVGGTLRAITGCSRTPSGLICEFGTIAEDELAAASPGDFLFYENIREACEDGLAVYDFSVGDEGYKRLWCNLETRHRDATLPLGFKGHFAAAGLSGLNAAKRSIKSNPALWSMLRRLRRRDIAEPVRGDG